RIRVSRVVVMKLIESAQSDVILESDKVRLRLQSTSSLVVVEVFDIITSKIALRIVAIHKLLNQHSAFLFTDVNVVECKAVKNTIGLVVAVATKGNSENYKTPVGRRYFVEAEPCIFPTSRLTCPGKAVFATNRTRKVLGVVPIDTSPFSR